MKAVVFSDLFIPPEELIDYCIGLGMDEVKALVALYGVTFDQRIVNFCERHAQPLWDEMVYKGAKDSRFRIGFAGAGYIREIDTSKNWRIRYNDVDAPVIEYIEVNTNEYGQTWLIPSLTKN